MKRRLLELLCCPVCGGSMELTIFHESERRVGIASPAPSCSERCELWGAPLGRDLPAPDADECCSCYSREIDEGLLVCSGCGSFYPIVNAVPRLVRNAEQE